MAGIYIHIPFCKKICSYCDFFKKTTLSLLPDYLTAIEREMADRSAYLGGETVETIYIGGGTPSVLSTDQLERIFSIILRYYKIGSGYEITLEANPDDLTRDYLSALSGSTPINRLSIGIQSFHDDDLKMLNRRHNALQAERCIDLARDAGFRNISIDLIYGLPGLSTSAWKENLDIAFTLDVPHISAYHLTLGPGTALTRMHDRGLIRIPEEEESARQFFMLNRIAGERGFVHYEISNLAREGFLSRHNSNYWLGKKYLGLGPSAHSFDLVSRQWNVSNLPKYFEALLQGGSYYSSEDLDIKSRYNEYLMLSLRTCQGVSIPVTSREFGEKYTRLFEHRITPLLQTEWMIRNDDTIILTPAGWLVSDYIVSRLLL